MKSRRFVGQALRSLLLVGLLAVTPQPGHAALHENSCGRDAESWEVMLKLAGRVSPEEAARSYLELYGVPYFNREAKAIFKRMVDDGQEMEAAMEVHIAKYHSAKSAAEQEAIRKEVRRNMAFGLETHDLIVAFERVTVTPADYRARMMNVLKRWQEPEQPYMGQFDQTAEKYRAGGTSTEEAGLRAFVETFNTLDRTRAAPPDLLRPGTPCYDAALYRGDFAMRMLLLDEVAPGAKGRLERLTVSSYQKYYRSYRPEAWMNALGLMK